MATCPPSNSLSAMVGVAWSRTATPTALFLNVPRWTPPELFREAHPALAVRAEGGASMLARCAPVSRRPATSLPEKSLAVIWIVVPRASAFPARAVIVTALPLWSPAFALADAAAPVRVARVKTNDEFGPPTSNEDGLRPWWRSVRSRTWVRSSVRTRIADPAAVELMKVRRCPCPAASRPTAAPAAGEAGGHPQRGQRWNPERGEPVQREGPVGGAR